MSSGFTMGLRYRVQYHRGVDNGAADALSRRGAPEELLAVSSPMHDWLSDLAQWYQSDAEAQSLLSQLVVNPSARPPFSLQQGIIKYKDHIWLGSNVTL
jgi:hypothetical protein